MVEPVLESIAANFPILPLFLKEEPIYLLNQQETDHQKFSALLIE